MEQAATVSIGNSTTTLRKIIVIFPQLFATVAV